MARVGDMDLGGHPSGCGVAFQLSSPAPCSHVYSNPKEPWEVQMSKGMTSVVARTSDTLGRSDVLAMGHERLQQCLDLLSFEKGINLLLKRPGDDHIILFVRDGVRVLQQVEVADLGVQVHAQVTVTDKDGNVVPQPPPPASIWNPCLRLYRLSQASTDLYEAYRNLWLGLESLLDAVCPKTPAEKERKWLLRALSSVGDLKAFVPATAKDPVAYIVGTQYDYIRCRVFHSKNAPVAHTGIPNPEKVASAYQQLIRLWREVAQRHLSVHPVGGGGMTYVGFKTTLGKTLNGRMTMSFTGDPSPCTEEDVAVSPAGYPVFPFAKVTYLGETSPGRVSFVGSQPMSRTGLTPVIHRICSKADEVLFTAWSTDDGLSLEDIDLFESYQTCRLVSRNLPRTLFA